MIQVADRLHTVEEYYFSRKLREVNLLKANGKPIINLGIGSPDLQPPAKVITAIANSFQDASAHKYQSYQGLPELREAITQFYSEQFAVHVSPTTEVLPLMGSKEGIMHISMAFLNEGDEVLIPNPGYPTYASVTKLLGAKPVFYNLEESKGWLPDLKALEKLDLSKVKIMWLNYPHMPTGTKATEKLFEEVIAFARKHHILIVNDNPYSFILNDKPTSILTVRKAKDVCLELNSLSKTFNMAGWRVGMVIGNAKHIDAIIKVKSNMDSGMFYGIQKGAIEALNCSNMWYKSLNSVYKQRRKLVWKLADALNCTYNKEASGLFVWAKLPPHFKSEEFIDVLLKENHIFIAPGTIFGTQGEGYVRFSLCASTEDLEEALARI
ncbi:aminotransferase class I/II-fold pyridoxal phosphate-dependent enzyme [Oceanihabitans sp. 2_MG-2023]|uniref:pyridoxal phosphate-dependent aminotransferase n=1 Tax=Oceanihabitans sp. 2_MG-2023 TaxID=3062661 RepID=UPI0026E31B6F|nr:aminotransferase class I/II-fold pyridoxal phosphate-dependent enzyme [Oceanihabitans sp. 2_MG-2023]MDO6596204.1 aminotransferase class I/II-fold pyridoxal phosphate-dependent enzyme [Oceanihabitans sp. 2_MG-2023]